MPRPLCSNSIEIQSVLTCSNAGHLVHPKTNKQSYISENILHLHVFQPSVGRSHELQFPKMDDVHTIRRTIPSGKREKLIIILASSAFIPISKSFRVRAVRQSEISEMKMDGWLRRAPHYKVGSCAIRIH